mmetsp:Transcript_88877/g.203271  ORF Transcript_88877/g.203271 Transcript_88877/m.203271 type:complete len:200 (+) Transcript_88877:31-630(+)
MVQGVVDGRAEHPARRTARLRWPGGLHRRQLPPAAPLAGEPPAPHGREVGDIRGGADSDEVPHRGHLHHLRSLPLGGVSDLGVSGLGAHAVHCLQLEETLAKIFNFFPHTRAVLMDIEQNGVRGLPLHRHRLGRLGRELWPHLLEHHRQLEKTLHQSVDLGVVPPVPTANAVLHICHHCTPHGNERRSLPHHLAFPRVS